MDTKPAFIFANDSCKARQNDDMVISSGVYRREFFIAFSIEFVLPPAYPVEDEDDYLLVVPDMESRTSYHRIWAPCMFLETNNLPWKEISDLLTRFEIPLHKQPFMVHRITACADEMANKDSNRRRKVLPMCVSITVVVDYCVTEQKDGHSSCIKKAKNFADMKAVPANEASIVALEKEKIEEKPGSVNRCMVCLEEIRVGSEALRMPCKHVFHQFCIFSWLRVAGFCPVCLVYLPA